MRFDSDAIYTLPFLTGFLWALGGGGALWVRRLGVPVAIAAFSIYFKQTPLWLAAVQAIITHGATRLPYGNKVKEALQYFHYPYLYFIGAIYGLSQFVFAIYFRDFDGYCAGVVIASVVFGSLTWASQKINFPKNWHWTWKAVEAAIGFCVGLQAVLILS